MYKELQTFLAQRQVTLVAVSKTKPNSAILKLYDQGQRIFGENRVQELVQKSETLPSDIEWHMIGGLQKNKVKYLAPFISMIHSVDSLALAEMIDKQAAKVQRKIKILLQIKVALEDTKAGWSYEELFGHIAQLQGLEHLEICGVMGMGTFTSDQAITNQEFSQLKAHFDQLKAMHFSASSAFKQISMGMSGDYKLAVEHGSTMVRIGSLLFGSR